MKTVPQISLKVAKDSDTEFLYRVFQSVCAETLGHIDESMRTKLIEMQFMGQRSTYAENFPNAIDYLIHVAGRPVGRMLVNETPDSIKLVDIALLPEFRSQGIGGQAMALLIEGARENAQVVELSVARQNGKAESFYQRLGFERFAENEISIQMRLA